MSTPDFLHEEYTIDTPENVIFGYDIAGIGSRFIAALIDSILLGFALVATGIVLFVGLAVLTPEGVESLWADAEEWAAGFAFAAYVLLNFVIVWGYYICFELLWNGQTPGKRVAGIRVVQADGNSVTPVAVVVRNLVRIVDFFPSGYALGLVVMFFNRQSRRLGDFAAGTLVVKDRGTVTLDEFADFSYPEEDDADLKLLLDDFPTVHRLTDADYRLIREALRRHRRGMADDDLLRRLATVIVDKLDHTASEYRPPRDFLQDVLTAYRVASKEESHATQTPARDEELR